MSEKILQPHALDSRTRERVLSLASEFPDAHIREEGGYFVYDLKNNKGEPVEMRTPLWESIPFERPDGTLSAIPVLDAIRLDLEHRHEYGYDYSLTEVMGL
jgi:hypothetical protein